MKKTRNMYFKESVESRELELYARNNYKTYMHFKSVVENLNKKIIKDVYDYEKSITAFYYVINTANKSYIHDFGYSFDVQARYTVAVLYAKQFKHDTFNGQKIKEV
jgi:hypothetical protein